MKDIYIATAQFEHKSGDKNYNIEIMQQLTKVAANQGAQIVCFHELCVTGYTFLKDLEFEKMNEIAEPVPDGMSIQRLIEIAANNDIAILAGLVEKYQDKLYNTFVCVTKNGLIAKHRKLHPFISKFLSPGDTFTVFDLLGAKCGILICYDNNIIENVRATTLLGAEILFAPHVTGCTPSPMPGRGFVDPKLWINRHKDPTSLRLAFDGPNGKNWLQRWLPARAYDNGIYVVFSNAIGMDENQLKPGLSMIIDPYGDIIVECRDLDNQVSTALCCKEKIKNSGGTRYKGARRPELYSEILSKENLSDTRPYWLTNE